MKDILVGMDGSERSDAALRWAVDEASCRGVGVHALVACAPASRPDRVDRLALSIGAGDIESAGRQVVTPIVEQVGAAHPEVPVWISAVYDDTMPALMEAAKDALMLVLGDRGLGPVRRLWLGSVSNSCLHRASIPVALVRPGFTGRAGRPVVVGVDSSTASEVALCWAADEAALRHVPLHVVHIFQPLVPGMLIRYPAADPMAEDLARTQLNAIIQRCLQDRDDVQVTTELVVGPIAEMLMNRAREGQLLVVGSRGRGGFTELLLGSISHQCATHHRCPIVVVPSGPRTHG